ncbi:MAG: hypothetical protein JNM38_14690 [Acidobacteria bacterium]|nr:hypothetical protein [Acidobacteriota bacterium]
MTPRSDKVTVVAWNLILVGGMTIGLGALQLVVVTLLLPPGALQMALDQLGDTMPSADDMRWIVDYIVPILWSLVVFGVVSLVAGIGLLRRSNWARRLVICLLWLTILAHVAGMVAPFFGSPAVVIAGGIVLGLLVCVLSALLILFLQSADVRAEFIH